MAAELSTLSRRPVFWLSVAVGVLVGAGLGVLFAPRAGAETRGRLKDTAVRARRRAAGGYRAASATVSRLVERGRRTYDRLRGRSVAAGEAAQPTVAEPLEPARVVEGVGAA
jgi:hypothetical protein